MSALPSGTMELVIRNEIAQLAIVSEALERIGEEHGFALKPMHQLQVALDEIVSNVIKYAWPEGGCHEIRVRITVSEGKVTIDIADDGTSFDPRDAPPPPPHSPGQRPRPGGLGIHMVKQFIDKFDYERVNGWNHSILTKQCYANMQAN